jgi:hypothetical protein
MLTTTEKSILQNGNIKGKPKKAGDKYKSQVKYRATVKAKNALSDLELLAQIYPKAIDAEKLLKLIEAYLNQESFKITKKERIRKGLPRNLKRKLRETGQVDIIAAFKGKNVVEFGSLREKSGAPLRKNIGQELYFCMMLLKIIKKSIDDSTILGLEPLRNEALMLVYNDGKFSLLNYKL